MKRYPDHVSFGTYFDRQKAYIIHWVRLDQYSSTEEAYKDGIKRLDTLVSKVHDVDP